MSTKYTGWVWSEGCWTRACRGATAAEAACRLERRRLVLGLGSREATLTTGDRPSWSPGDRPPGVDDYSPRRRRKPPAGAPGE
jgi:hypothetical protein